MKLKALTTVAFLATFSLATPITVFAQPSPTGQYVPGFWQPEAQVDPSRDITILLLNETGVTLEYGQGGVDIRTVPPGGVANVGIKISNRTGDIASIPINPQQGNAALEYDYNVADNNVVQVRIRQQSGSEPLDRAVYIDETGRVYSF